MGLAVVTLRVTKSSCIVGDWVHGQCPQELEDNHQTRVCVAARPATRFPSCGDSSESLSVSANHLSGTLKGLMVITPPPLAQRTRIITWFLNDCAGYALAFHQKKKKKCPFLTFSKWQALEMSQFSHCRHLAALEFQDGPGKTPGDRKGKWREGNGTRVDIDPPFMQINAAWLTHRRLGHVGVHTSALPEVISLLFTRPSYTFSHLTGLPVRWYGRFAFPLVTPSFCQVVSLHTCYVTCTNWFPHLAAFFWPSEGNTPNKWTRIFSFCLFFLLGTIICLHRSSASSSLTPTNLMSPCTTSISLLTALSAHSNLSILLLTEVVSPSSLHVQIINVFISKTSYMSCCPSDGLIPDPFHPSHSQKEAQHVNLCYLQRCLLSYPQSPNQTTSLLSLLFTSFLLLLSHIAPDTFQTCLDMLLQTDV